MFALNGLVKQFHCVDLIKMLEKVKNILVNCREHKLIHNLYMGQRVILHLSKGGTENVEIRRGIRQGAACHPCYLI